VTDPTLEPIQPTALGEIIVPAASTTSSVSNTSDDHGALEDPTGPEGAVTATTSSDGTSLEEESVAGQDVDDLEEADAEDEGDDEDADDEDDDEPVYTIPTGPVEAVPEYRMALVSSVTVDLPSQHPTVLLRESESPRRQLTFSIGLQDGIVLSHAMRRIPTPRPLTHELLTTVLQKFDIDVVAVRLVGRQGAVYFAELDLRGRTGRSVLSARPSDALTLALLQPVPVPILIDGRLFETLGDVAPPG
jgi:bifunctional DNase/RNase